MISLARYMTLEITGDISHCYFMLYIAKLINQVAITTGQTATYPGFYSSLLNLVRAAAEISAGSVGSPQNQLYQVSYQSWFKLQ